MDLTDKSELIKYLKQNELWAKKSLGQNFLVDKEALKKIVDAAELKKTDTVLEIGPGFGVLTQELVKVAGSVIAIEKDDELANKLTIRSEVSGIKNIEIINGDILDLNIDDIINRHPEFISGSRSEVLKIPKQVRDGKSQLEMTKSAQNDRNKKYKLVANIPYYITSKILEKFLTALNKPELIVFLVQKEVAERICAKPGQTSMLSISVQFYGQPEIIDIVKSSSFFPEPKVDSAILRIKIKNKISNIKNIEEELFKVARAGFRSRRKTLVNNLMSGTNLSREELFGILEKTGLEKNVRAQELTVAEWQTLTDLLRIYKSDEYTNKE